MTSDEKRMESSVRTGLSKFPKRDECESDYQKCGPGQKWKRVER